MKLILFVLLAVVAFAQQPKIQHPNEPWTQLFNGKYLTGWISVGNEKWTVDGRLWIAWPSTEKEAVLRPNDWNHYLIKVDGDRYVAWLNGVLMVDFTDPQPKSFDGYIALQLHSGGEGNMRFKDIYLRDGARR